MTKSFSSLFITVLYILSFESFGTFVDATFKDGFLGKHLTRAEEVEETYDYVIIGGGTSGLTVADRLTENPHRIYSSSFFSLLRVSALLVHHSLTPSQRFASSNRIWTFRRPLKGRTSLQTSHSTYAMVKIQHHLCWHLQSGCYCGGSSGWLFGY